MVRPLEFDPGFANVQTPQAARNVSLWRLADIDAELRMSAHRGEADTPQVAICESVTVTDVAGGGALLAAPMR